MEIYISQIINTKNIICISNSEVYRSVRHH